MSTQRRKKNQDTFRVLFTRLIFPSLFSYLACMAVLLGSAGCWDFSGQEPEDDAGPGCGNGIINGDEVCDGNALGGETCGSQGFYGGSLSCRTDCSDFDTSGCLTTPPVTWITISGGTFDMGSEDGSSYELPVHSVTVPTFEMTKTQVTVEQYEECVTAGVCTAPSTGTRCNWEDPGYEDHPVNCITWYKAREFCEWAGGRLPSEAEWEYAARSGGQDITYPWGNETATCDYAVMDDGGWGCGTDRTWPVCSKVAGNTDQGLCDMAGNLWEWLEDDWHDDYNGARDDGSAWVDEPRGSNRVGRCGSFINTAYYLRAAYRGYDLPSGVYINFGVRCARDAPEPICGNNIREGDEVCDGSDLGGETCETQGFDAGTLACNADCMDFDTSGCYTDPLLVTWITISGGPFGMGSNDGESNEQPIHLVTVPTFEMTKTQVTVEQYKECVTAGVCMAPATTNIRCNWEDPGYEDHPANCITWYKAREFCEWAGGRLPSEAEWEYAARSGGQDITYPWGNDTATCDYAVMDDGEWGCGTDRTWPVCSKVAGNTDQGLCDMAGNVWEWLEDDWHGDYNGAPDDGSAWVDEPRGSSRIFRGGSFTITAAGFRAAYRAFGNPSFGYGDLSVRCARDAP